MNVNDFFVVSHLVELAQYTSWIERAINHPFIAYCNILGIQNTPKLMILELHTAVCKIEFE